MEKINIAELLRNCPKGMELDCTMYDNIVFDYIDEKSIYPIKCRAKITEVGSNSHEFTKNGQPNHYSNAKCVIFPKGKTTWEGFVPPHQFKDGDILVHTQNQRFVMSIYHKEITGFIIETHCILWDKDEGLSVNKEICCYPDNTRLATEEEKEKLFQAIKEYGYKWNSETKTLEKLVEPKFKVGDRIRHKNGYFVVEIIKVTEDGRYKFKDDIGEISYFNIEKQEQYELVPNKFDINTLVPFEKVLVRDNDTQEWVISFFSHCNGLEKYKYSCINNSGYAQCVPYEENKHLFRTTNDCDDFYKTWEK